MRPLDTMASLIALVLLLTGCAPALPPAGADTRAAPEDPAEAAAELVQPPATVTPVSEGPLPSPEELAALRSALQRAPDDARARRRLAIALFETGDTDEALAMFEEDTRANPGPASLLNLGRAYDRVLRYRDAEATYRAVLRLAPAHPIALHALGNLALKRGDTAEAIGLYRQAIDGEPDYLLAHVHLADALKQHGDSPAAHAAYARVLDLKPTNAQEAQLYQDAVYNLAALDIAAGEYDRAAGLLEDLLRAQPDHASANYAYGTALLRLGREDEAQRAFDHHLRLQAERQATSPAAMGD